MVESQHAEQQFMDKQEYFCTCGSFQCSDFFDFIVVLVTRVTVAGLRMSPTLQTHPLGRGWDKYSPEQLEPSGRFLWLCGTRVAQARVRARCP